MKQKSSSKWQGMLLLTLKYIVLIIGAILFLLPFLFMLSMSLTDSHELFQIPFRLIPRSLNWLNYKEAWTENYPFNLFLKNTIFVTGIFILGQVTVCSLVAYSFARLRWRGRNLLFTVLLSTLMLPAQVVIIPQFIYFSKLGWVNTYYPLLIPWIFGRGAFPIFLLRQFYMTIPLDLDEAAKIDGATYFQIYYKILLPLLKPALGVVAINGFMFQWNNFFEPLIYINEKAKFTLALGLRMFQAGEFGTYWNFLMADSVLVALPCFIIFFLFQKYLVQGTIIGGGLKG